MAGQKPPGYPRPPALGHSLAELRGILGLAEGGSAPAQSGGPTVTGVTLDSRAVRPGDLYAALPGMTTHGARFAEGAVAAGAVAILTDEQGAQLVSVPVPVLVVADPRGRLGEVSAWVYGRPADDLLVIGITGTNGKTTTSFLIDAALRAHGHRTGMVGTVAITVGDEAITAIRTTPEAPDLHGLLGYMRHQGVTAVTMEVSSHAMSMGRVDGVRFDLVVFTNLSQDHLDFHPSMQDYFQAKASLFDSKRADVGLICVDDQWGRDLAGQVSIPRSTYGLTGRPDWLGTDLQAAATGGTSFRLVGPAGAVSAGVALPGRFNVANAVAAVAAANMVGVDLGTAAGAVASCPGVPGRMEPVSCGQPFLVVVDYAHTPDALDRAIAAARGAGQGRVITVMGCGGDRDREKRPIMGGTAAMGSDILVVTDDNPRSESPQAIRAAIMGGVMAVPEPQRAVVHDVADRAVAIRAAIELALPGDVVLVAGKGHEQGQEVAGVVTPFDDRVEVRRALAEVGFGQGGPQ